MDSFIQHLKFPHGPASFVMKHGRFFLPATKPDDIDWETPRMCFMNAARLALSDHRLTYVEGFAHSGILPVDHAWVVDSDGRLIDNTWRTVGLAYLGVPITITCLRRSLMANGYYGVLGGMGYMPYIYKLKPKALKAAIKKLKDTTSVERKEAWQPSKTATARLG